MNTMIYKGMSWYLGYPSVMGSTILEKRRYVRSNLDHLRKMLMFEPRGHMDMYGALLVEKDLDEADMAVLFMHNEGKDDRCMMLHCESSYSCLIM